MRVLYQSRTDLFDIPGGDTFQIEYTKKYIEKLDPTIKIDINLETKAKDIEKYDIIHLYNLDWIPETYVQAKHAKKHNKKIVLSAIHHSEDEVKRYEKEKRYDIRRIYNLVIPWQSVRDLWKNIYRSTFGRQFEKFSPTVTQIFKGIRNEQMEIVKMSDMVLVQTNIEADDIKEDFAVEDFQWRKVINGVNTEIFKNAESESFLTHCKKELKHDFTNEKIILNVGRIEPRKDQLSLIKAFNELKAEGKLKDYKLVFIGAYGKRSFEYNFRFKNAIKKSADIYYLGPLDQEVVASAMSMPGVYVHTSWFETTGLVCLEASLAGMPVCAGGNRVKEYMGENAEYFNPGDIESIKNAILKSSKKSVSKDLKSEILTKFTWQETAKQVVDVYKILVK